MRATPAPPIAPKIATLARLAAAGLPVPAYVALTDRGEPDPAAWIAIDELLRGGPVIVRAALPGEDTAERSGAGLGSSVPGCRDRADILAALRQITAALDDPWLAAYFGGPPRAQVLVQREIVGPWLAVVAQAQVCHVELHRRDPGESHFALREPDRSALGEPLAAGSSPALAGPLELFPAELREPIARLCAQVGGALPGTRHGLDLELVADHDGHIWVVQARPLTRPLHPGWPAFAAAARPDLDREAPTPASRHPEAPSIDDQAHDPNGLGAPSIDDQAHDPNVERLPLPGLWTLDAEHNPAPLSLAHAGLIRSLATRKPSSAHMHVLAGWLYTPGRIAVEPRPTSPTALRAAFTTLTQRHIPDARAELTRIEHLLAAARSVDLPALIDLAYKHLARVLEHHAGLPIRPARLTASADASCLQGRGDHLDVLPATWDIASPTLLDLSLGPAADTPPLSPTVPEDPDVLATLLGELDDHLFALGLAPLRRVYLRAAQLLAIAADDIFLLAPEELAAASRGTSYDLDRRRRHHAHQSTLFPPLQLHDGLPVPAPANSHLRGIAIGPVVEGPLHLRQDLAELLADPPPPGAVLAIPALTAQAAVVLHTLGVRAVCCEHGGALSHAALMARELGMSALIGCHRCTAVPPGSHVRLDTRTGHLRVRRP